MGRRKRQIDNTQRVDWHRFNALMNMRWDDYDYRALLRFAFKLNLMDKRDLRRLEARLDRAIKLRAQRVQQRVRLDERIRAKMRAAAREAARLRHRTPGPRVLGRR